MSLYQILELEKSANYSDIKKSYYKLAKKYHPDKNKNGTDKFRQINLAYTILSNNESKKKYDEKLDDIDPYTLIQNIINKNNLTFINSIFNFVYDDNNELKNDINKFNFKGIYNKIINNVNLDIVSNINIDINKIYFDECYKLLIKRNIDGILKDYNLNVKFDIYDEEIQYDGLGDKFKYLVGNLKININQIISENMIILDDYNILIKSNNLNYILFNKIKLNEQLKIKHYEDNIKIIYEYNNLGFFNGVNRGKLYQKILK